MKKNELIKILKEILKVESVDIKNYALESLIEKLEENNTHEKTKYKRNK